VLAIAAAATESALGAALLRRVLPLVEDVGIAVALMRVCQDGPLGRLVEIAASEELSHERESAML
jgi:hypothetical protein